MIWFILIPVVFMFVVGSVFSYRADLRCSRWFMPVYIAASVGCAVCWVWAVRALDDQKRIYFLSLVWDLLMVVCYYLLPLVLFDFKFNKWTWFGVGLMLVGLAVVKIKGN